MRSVSSGRDTVQIRTLRRAVEVVGDAAVLALFLTVSSERLKLWLSGEDPIPTDAFLATVDIVNNEAKIQAAGVTPASEKGTAMRAVMKIRALLASGD